MTDFRWIQACLLFLHNIFTKLCVQSVILEMFRRIIVHAIVRQIRFSFNTFLYELWEPFKKVCVSQIGW